VAPPRIVRRLGPPWGPRSSWDRGRRRRSRSGGLGARPGHPAPQPVDEEVHGLGATALEVVGGADDLGVGRVLGAAGLALPGLGGGGSRCPRWRDQQRRDGHAGEGVGHAGGGVRADQVDNQPGRSWSGPVRRSRSWRQGVREGEDRAPLPVVGVDGQIQVRGVGERAVDGQVPRVDRPSPKLVPGRRAPFQSSACALAVRQSLNRRSAEHRCAPCGPSGRPGSGPASPGRRCWPGARGAAVVRVVHVQLGVDREGVVLVGHRGVDDLAEELALARMGGQGDVASPRVRPSSAAVAWPWPQGTAAGVANSTTASAPRPRRWATAVSTSTNRPRAGVGVVVDVAVLKPSTA